MVIARCALVVPLGVRRKNKIVCIEESSKTFTTLEYEKDKTDYRQNLPLRRDFWSSMLSLLVVMEKVTHRDKWASCAVDLT